MKLLDIPPQTAPAEIDEEILEIFVEEVQEVQEEITQNFAAWKANMGDSEALQTLRRAFHTLKGSGRLVGASAIGELGWRFENMLNRVIDNTFAANQHVLTLIAQVEHVLPEMIEQFQQGQEPTHKIVLLISQANHLTETKGESIGEFDLPAEEKSAGDVATPTAAISDETTAPPVVDEIDTVPLTTDTTEEAIPEAATLDSLPDEFAAEDEDAAAISLDDSSDLTDLDALTADVDLEDIDLNLDALDIAEETTLDELDLDIVDADLVVDSASIGDTSSDTLELESTPSSLPSTPAAPSTLIDPMLLDIFKGEAIEHLEHLTAYLKNYNPNTPESVPQSVVRAFHTLTGSSRSVEINTISRLTAPMENFTRLLHDRELPFAKPHLELVAEVVKNVNALLNGEMPDEKQQSALLRLIQETYEKLQVTSVTPVTPSSSMPPQAIPAVSSARGSEVKSASTKTTTFEIPDATDEFMMIFLEEAEEILENTQSLLERWQSAPHNMQLMKELQRELHTLKGGARMVGIVPMGDLSHHLESILTRIVEGTAQSNEQLPDIVQNSVDELAAMLESVRNGVALEVPGNLIQRIDAALSGDAPAETPTIPSVAKPHITKKATPEPTAKPVHTTSEPADNSEGDSPKSVKPIDKTEDETGEDRIRVRVSLIEKLTSLVGELSIHRARMEQQQSLIKNNINEMEQTIMRLRDQLRRLEIETEAQILSHYRDITGVELEEDNEEFDPLEMDRFSLLQQLSRSLSESVNDLLNIQDNLKILTRQADNVLIQQTRVGTDLQDGILRTRMIPFSRISPRLQRLARLTARELHKQIDFIIEGEEIEFERTVLNRVVAPLEHLLRNAIGHGVEDAEVRKQAGKPPIARVKITLMKEGSDLIIKLQDDGAGLNLLAIRKKAEERGLLSAGAVIDDRELMQFILEPSFSTAQKITQVSGRGVGMDVVNSEIKQLGGNLQIHSTTGKGAMFEIRLPLSMTITQALLVSIAEETLAIPMGNIDAIMRIPRQDILHHDQAEAEIYHTYMNQQYRAAYLGKMLGFAAKVPEEKNVIPTLLIRAGDKRVALMVDGVEGSREIVVKSVGPQISAIRWIAGATILGDGRVVIILDVPTLTRTDQLPKIDVIQIEATQEEKPQTSTIMVVDDSITVRKVTARLLKRQGMEVLTAKDGVDAFAQLQEHIPDLMLLDVEMPRMDGYELATQVRNAPELKHIPIIMITSRTGTKHRDRADKIGVNRYLGKPFNEPELLENIQSLLRETEELRRNAYQVRQQQTALTKE